MIRTDPGHLLPDWFDRARATNPDSVALHVGGRRLRYQELFDAADATAERLTAAAGQRPTRVGLVVGKTVEAYVGLLAAWRIGAAVVPLGPDLPVQRNIGIAAAAHVDALVFDEWGAEQMKWIESSLAPIQGVTGVTPDTTGSPSAPPSSTADPSDLAYVLFTSGSTGAPKGVPISHRNATAYLRASLPRYDIGPGDVVSQIHELTFDFAMLEILLAWASGACLRPLTRLQALNPARYIRDDGITFWGATPSFARALGTTGKLTPGALAGLRHTSFSGEPLPVALARQWSDAAPGCVVDNLYGPTEATITCIGYRFRPDTASLPSDRQTVPIGTAFPDVDHILLDDEGRVVPDGPGELCLAGPQVFGGYLDPADNDGRFLHQGGRTWYRTGDLARLDPHLGLVHLGRNDGQVKIRGYRVELSEVEQAILDEAGVTDTAVLVVEGTAGPRLVAFILDNRPLDIDSLLTRLAARLPAHMLPAAVWRLAEPPLNRNGKTDRQALRVEARRRLRIAAMAPSA